jgi:hypothetical protein
MSGLRKLNMMDFTTLIPVRESKIEAAKAEKLPEIDSYKANQIANALHPAVQNLVVSEVAEINADAKLYTLSPDSEKGCLKLAYFSAGQYLSIKLKIDAAITSRPYTICSSPSDSLKGIYKILVKRAEKPAIHLPGQSLTFFRGRAVRALGVVINHYSPDEKCKTTEKKTTVSGRNG